MADGTEFLETMSCSKYDMIQRCGFATYMRYVEGVKSPPTAALAFGRADDETKNRVYDDKISSGGAETATVGDCREMFAENFEECSTEVEEWGTDDKGKLKDVGVNLIGEWRDACAVQTIPVETQIEFHCPITYNKGEGEFDFMGYIDFVEETADQVTSQPMRVITDNKTAGRRWTKKYVGESTQAVGYGVAAERDPHIMSLGVTPNEVHFHVAVKTKNPVIQHPLTDPDLIRVTDERERRGFLRMLARAHSMMSDLHRSGNWLPNRKNFLCSQRWCGYHERCVREFGGNVKP